MTAMRTACYARFSSDQQRATSIDDQLATARNYAEHQGWIVLDAHIYSDAAVSPRRPPWHPGPARGSGHPASPVRCRPRR